MNNKIRKEVVLSKLKMLKNSLYYVKEFLPSDFKFLENRKDKNALYKETEFAIQLIIDICSVINSDISKEMPSDEDSIIDSLRRNKVLSDKITKVLHEMIGFRNILVHKYGDIDDKKAYKEIKDGIKDFELVIEEVEGFLMKLKKWTNRLGFFTEL